MAAPISWDRYTLATSILFFLTACVQESIGYESGSLPSSSANDAQHPDIENFLIQDVCADLATDQATSLDPYDCPENTRRRNLHPGEALPYHKHDQPDCNNPRGFQISDSFPVKLPGSPPLYLKTFDFKSYDNQPSGTAFREFNGSDGYDIHIAAQGQVSIAATRDPSAQSEDPMQGVQYFVAPEGVSCDIFRSWSLFPTAWPVESGALITQLNIARSRHECPSFYNSSYTSWSFEKFDYPDGAFEHRDCTQKTGTKTLDSLIVTHWGGSDPHPPNHKEVFFFTKLYGATRWERWEERQGTYAMVDSRSWTNIRPDPNGGYDPRNWHLPPDLGVNNYLQNGDWGRGKASQAPWLLADSAVCKPHLSVIEEDAGEYFQNHYATVSFPENCAIKSIHQTVDRQKLKTNEGAPLTFGGTFWADKSSRITLNLLQMHRDSDGNDATVDSDTFTVDITPNKRQAHRFKSKPLRSGVTHVRWKLEVPNPQTSVSFDDAFLAAW
jgi:hypothetical protein